MGAWMNILRLIGAMAYQRKGGSELKDRTTITTSYLSVLKLKGASEPIKTKCFIRRINEVLDGRLRRCRRVRVARSPLNLLSPCSDANGVNLSSNLGVG